MTRLPVAALLMLAACAPAPPLDSAAAPAPVRGDSGHVCDAGALSGLTGMIATQALASDALNRSGARSLRWIQPGMMVTMDYRQDRLNIYLDEANRVRRVSCG